MRVIIAGGRDEILVNLHYVDDVFLKYRRSIPEQLAMGDALAIAYRVQAENKRKMSWYALQVLGVSNVIYVSYCKKIKRGGKL